jgi:hypothetical protein
MEMRIPFSSLRFQPRGDRVVMGIGASRLIARTSERHVFPAIRPDRSSAYLKPSLLQDVALDGVRSRLPLYLSPFALTGMQRAYASDPSQGGGERSHRLTTELGLDLKYSLTSNLTLDLTANTDFAQVEADDQQVNLTPILALRSREAPLLPGARRHLLLPAGGVEPALPQPADRPLRRGAADPDPRRRPDRGPPGGVGRGRAERADARGSGAGAENFGVVRLRRQVLNANSTIGVATYNADGRGRETRRPGGRDGRHDPPRRETTIFTFNLARTAGEGHPEPSTRGSRARRCVGGARLGGTTSSAGPTRGRHFEPAVGVETHERLLVRGWRADPRVEPGAGSRLRRHSAGADGRLVPEQHRSTPGPGDGHGGVELRERRRERRVDPAERQARRAARSLLSPQRDAGARGSVRREHRQAATPNAAREGARRAGWVAGRRLLRRLARGAPDLTHVVRLPSPGARRGLRAEPDPVPSAGTSSPRISSASASGRRSTRAGPLRRSCSTAARPSA